MIILFILITLSLETVWVWLGEIDVDHYGDLNGLNRFLFSEEKNTLQIRVFSGTQLISYM